MPAALKVLGVVCDPPIDGIEEVWEMQMRELGDAVISQHCTAAACPESELCVSWTFVRAYAGEPLPRLLETHEWTSSHDSQTLLADAVIFSGSSFNVTDVATVPWMQELLRWVRGYMHLDDAPPTLGICFGHQLLCVALGGTVDFIANGAAELGTVVIAKLSNSEAEVDPIFNTSLGPLPDSFHVQETHFQCVSSLPSTVDSVSFYGSQTDVNQFVRFCKRRPGSRRCAYGVQFHPEYTMRYMMLLASMERLFDDAQQRTNFQKAIQEADSAAVGVVARFLLLASMAVA